MQVRMAVVMRRKLHFYYWKNRKFHKLQVALHLTICSDLWSADPRMT